MTIIPEIFQQNINQYKNQEKSVTKKLNLVSTVRTLVFIIAVFLIVYYANQEQSMPLVITVIVFLVVFILLIRSYNRLNYQKHHLIFLQNINSEEIQRKKVILKDFDSGNEYLDAEHHYVNDLDIFGKNSLFQLLNRTTTGSGRLKLAEYLKYPQSVSFIHAQQAAVKELAEELEWRQELQALGRHYKEQKNFNQVFFSWIDDPVKIANSKFLPLVTDLLTALIITGVIMSLVFKVSFYLPLSFFVINTIILYRNLGYAREVTDKTSDSIKALGAYELMIDHIEKSEFHNERLQQLKSNFLNDKYRATYIIKKLKDILDRLSSRSNLFYGVLNPIFMLDIRILLAAERWKLEARDFIKSWFDTVNEFEVINSLAGLSYGNPDYSFPEVSEGNHLLHASKLGHPLINPEKRVVNDYGEKMGKKIALITGSNMSGKSTFLRTIGINVVLALAGGPVLARSFKVNRYQVFTSMRTQDDLEQNVSSFYAELKRIHQLLELLKNDQQTPVLFFLDEILKGTNSRDRHRGAIALVKQLHGLNTSGFVSTHDLELTSLEDEMDHVVNYSFESSLKDGELYFDYKLHPGITESFNASILMAKMGIEFDKNDKGF